MAKMTEEEKIADQFDRLDRARQRAIGKLGKNNSNTKADGDEAAYAFACEEYISFGREHGLTNQMPLKKKYRKS